jgi:hypothetical protein
MRDFGIVHGSAAQAVPLIISVDTVYVHTDIEEVEDEFGGTMWRYHEVQYDKDEYILMLAERAADLQNAFDIIAEGVLNDGDD